MSDGALSKYGEAGGRYIDLFVGALRQYGMLCIGLYRYKLTFPTEFQCLDNVLSLDCETAPA